MEINFFEEDYEFQLSNEEKARVWIEKVVETYDKKTGFLNFIFTSEENILEINKQYLNHDYYTDIITFDYCTGNLVSGDLIISLDTVSSNSKKFNSAFITELHRVIIHGVLHLLGFKDKNSSEANEMRRNEDLALQQLKTIV